MYDSRIGRWSAVEPLADKYPHLSTYAFVANMPVRAIDPDGRRIQIVGGHSFQFTTMLHIAKLRATSWGREIIDDLIDSPHTYVITEVWFADNSKFQPKYKGGTLRYATETLKPLMLGGSTDGFLLFAHEIFHAWDYDQGGTDGKLYRDTDGRLQPNRKDHPMMEKKAVRFTNYVRSVYDYPFFRYSYFPYPQYWPSSFDDEDFNKNLEKVENLEFYLKNDDGSERKYIPDDPAIPQWFMRQRDKKGNIVFDSSDDLPIRIEYDKETTRKTSEGRQTTRVHETF